MRGYMPVAAFVMSGALAITMPAEPQPELHSPAQLQDVPVIVLQRDGEMVYHGEAVADFATLDRVLADRPRGHVPEKWRAAVIVHGRADGDAGRVIAVGTHLEHAGYMPLYSVSH